MSAVPGIFPDLAIPQDGLYATKAKVAVVGGGLSGLVAAWVLNYVGVQVTVFEATNRLGGRVYTLDDFVPGAHIEAGAELIGENHPRWGKFARLFGLHLDRISTEEEYDPEPDKREPDKNERKPVLTVRLILEGRTLVKDEKWAVYNAWKAKARVIEGEAAGINAIEPWKSRNAEKYDGKSITKRLDEPDLWGPNWRQSRRNDRTIYYARVFMNFLLGNDQSVPADQQSYLGLLAQIKGHAKRGDLHAYWTDTETHKCREGNQQLATRLAKSLGFTGAAEGAAAGAAAGRGGDPLRVNMPIRMNTPIKSIDMLGPTVRLRSGPNDTDIGIDFNYVILACPSAVWPDIYSSPEFRKQDYRMAQGPAVKFLSKVKWDLYSECLQRQIAPKTLWDEIGSVWEGTDLGPKKHYQDRKPFWDLTVFSGNSYVQPGPEKPDAKIYQQQLEKIYPGYTKNLVDERLVNWPMEPWIMTGYAVPAPGQVCTIGKRLNEPFLERLYFAGEQASLDFRGYMEGAIAAGFRAAARLALKLGLKNIPRDFPW